MKFSLEWALWEAAIAASRAVSTVIKKYEAGSVTDEDDITGVLIGQLDAVFDKRIGGINWSSSILRHRKGVAAQEKKVGADMLFHVKIETPQLNCSKGVLIQSKRINEGAEMTANGHKELMGQCDKMLDITPASFVFNYMKSGMRYASATRISGASSRVLSDSCSLSSLLFFFELFQCTIGDRSITSAKFDDFQIPRGIAIKGTLG